MTRMGTPENEDYLLMIARHVEAEGRADIEDVLWISSDTVRRLMMQIASRPSTVTAGACSG